MEKKGSAEKAVRETRVGVVADVGTLQRLPRVVTTGHVTELVLHEPPALRGARGRRV